MKFSLRWLLGLVAFAAIACYAMAYASKTVNQCLSVSLFMFLAASILGSIYAVREHRPFWIGCAVIGWLYVADLRLPGRPNGLSPSFAVHQALSELHKPVARKVPTAGGFRDDPNQGWFIEAGQAIAAFATAVAGGAIATWFDHRSKKHQR